MAATNRFQLLVESQSKGEAEIARLNATVEKLSASVARANRQMADSYTATQGRVSSSVRKITDDTSKMGMSITDAIRNPSQAAGIAVDGLLAKLSSTSGIAGAAAAGAITLATALFSVAKATGDLAEQQQNNSIRLGVSIKEYGILSQISEEAGIASDSLVTSIKGLSKALDEGGDAGSKGAESLRQLGIEAKNAYGTVKPTKDLLLEIATALGNIQDPSERARRAIDVLGRGAIENLPILNDKLRETYAEMEKFGVGFDENGVQAALRFDSALDKVGRTLSIVKREAGTFFANALLPDIGGRQQKTVVDRREQGVLGKLFLGQLPGLPAGNPSVQDLLSFDKQSTRSRIDKFLGTDPRVELDNAKTSLRKAIDDNDEASVRRLKIEVDRLEERAKNADALKKMATLEVDSSKLLPFIVGNTRVPTLRGRNSSLPDLPEFVARQVDIDRANEFNDGGLGARSAEQQQKDRRERELNESFARRFLEFEERKVELLTGPGGELDSINRIYELKKAGLEQELQYGSEIFNLTERRLQIEQERTLSILNLQRQRRDEASGLASDFVRSIQSGDPASFFKAQGSKLINQVGTNALTGTFQRVQSTLGRFGASTGLGKLLGGTILDPANATPLDKTAAATERTAVATERIAASVSGGIPGAGGSLRGFDPFRALGPASGFTSGFTSTLGQITGGAASVLAPGGLFAGLRPEGSIQLGNGRATTALGLGLGGTAARTANVAGSIAALGAGTLTAIRGFQQGGLSGITQGITASLGTAALIPGPQQPFIAAAAATAALVSMLLPDPKKARDRAINRSLEDAYYAEASPLAYNFDQMGYGYDTNRRGDMRQDVTIVVQTLDAKSFSDNRDLITDAVRQSVYEGHALNRAMRETLLAA